MPACKGDKEGGRAMEGYHAVIDAILPEHVHDQHVHAQHQRGRHVDACIKGGQGGGGRAMFRDACIRPFASIISAQRMCSDRADLGLQ